MTLNDQLKKHRIQLQKKFGQNFISDPALLERIADVCDWQAGDVALEIGPGAGTLTQAIAARAERVVAIEIDKRLAPVLAENLADLDNVDLVFGDALKTDLDALAAEHFGTEARYKLVANLPYYITTPLIMHVLEDCAHVDELVIMVQKEVAERLTARPGSRTYGAITVMVQYACEIRRAFDVGRRAFTPAPEVDSAILHLRPFKARPIQAADDAAFRRVVKAAFSQRRKTLRNSLASLGASKDAIAAALAEAGIADGRRAETLSVQDFVTLSDVFYKRGDIQ
ncbi:MAG: 16S rRNA (adenine(1518)-N(6)/adenine(1519)-N(6))-dimethyltransferase RsmA [Peptococcaceae bacterium]|nr:16S rRNA (adenine(1518)-N(6)/adenine(1519)-N(6))-dimethyltransferase RsmA [Peptococcaceae bacterium]